MSSKYPQNFALAVPSLTVKIIGGYSDIISNTFCNNKCILFDPTFSYIHYLV